MEPNVETEPEEEPTRRARSHDLYLRWVLPGENRSFRLREGATLLGRAEDCPIRLEHGRISRRHARIVKHGHLFVMEDLGSTNGIYVDGNRVARGLLQAGTVVRIAQFLAVIESVGEGEIVSPCMSGGAGLLGGLALHRVLKQALRVASSTLPVVLEGETGTGKELFARTLHQASGRNGPFHALNCAALNPSLADAELFGHRKGAFTGADRHHSGHLLAAHHGTLFLDEVSDLDLQTQAKLLRALENRELMMVGETRAIQFDTRVVAATQRPLPELVACGAFREDLAMRLGGIRLTLPPLRERRGDVPQLLHHFLHEFSPGDAPVLSVKALERLCLSPWPGNVRELRLLAQRLGTLLSNDRELEFEDLPGMEHEFARQKPSTLPPTPASIEQELARFQAALRQTGGNVSAAAELSGVSRTRIYRLLRGRSPLALLEVASEPKT
jgi:transcriptional regulator of acetoin/glycerol metabolism